MSIYSFLPLIVFFCSIGLVFGQHDVCPKFGSDQTTHQRSSTSGIFMNFNAPSQCKGNVTGWKFCIYKNSDIFLRSTRITAFLMVYRQDSKSNNTYSPVSGSVREKQLRWNVVSKFPSFYCINDSLVSADFFKIQENDVIGVCIKEVRSFKPLLLVGISSGANMSTYQLDVAGYEQCQPSHYGSITGADLVLRSDSVLHVETRIAKSNSCSAGNKLPPADPAATLPAGTYLNTQSPVACGNHITKWHYCYYTGATVAGSTLSMTVAVWSLDSATNTYMASRDSIKNVILQPVQTPAKIYCVEVALLEEEYFPVSQGDVIGVVLPSENRIPVVGFSEQMDNHFLQYSSKEIFTPIQVSGLRSGRNLFVHLSATIDTLSSTTAELEVSSHTQTSTTAELEVSSHTQSLDSFIDARSNSTLNNTLNESERLLSDGVISSIAFSILLVLGIAIVVVLIVVVFGRHKKENVQSTATKQVLDNVIYDVPLNEIEENFADNIYEPMMSPFTSHDTAVDVYATPMDSITTYQMELEQLKNQDMSSKKENIYCEPGNTEEDAYAILEEKTIIDIPGDSISVSKVLGSGQFGTVHSGEWKESSKLITDVALKFLNSDAKQGEKLKFLQEAATMAQFRHSNVVTFYGITEKDGSMALVVELLPNGDLHKYLLSIRPEPDQKVSASTPVLLLHFSKQICYGMNYLSSLGFIHRDLASRNVLLSNEYTCKIADFGMSRDLNEDDYYTSSGGLIPVKWTAPEAIHYKKFSTASDVWSYGCVLYEIWSLGHKPFEDKQAIEYLAILDNGGRLPPPPGCPRKLYEIMIHCWSPTPNERPTFRDILLCMLENDCVVLNVPKTVTSTNPQAASLGAPLKTALSMYSDLQGTYVSATSH